MHPEAEEFAEALALDHATWLMGLLKKIYEDAFIHGYKHGVEDKESQLF